MTNVVEVEAGNLRAPYLPLEATHGAGSTGTLFLQCVLQALGADVVLSGVAG